MDTHLSHAHCSVIEHLRTSSHQLEIEIGKYANKPMEEWICKQTYASIQANLCYPGGIGRKLCLPL